MTPPTKKWDAIVVGSGQGGTPLARKLARAGMQTALIEGEHVGGTCINEGCTPTKTMIADAKLAQWVREAPDRGIGVAGFSVDLAQIIARKNSVVTAFRTAGEKGLAATPNLTLIRGFGSFSGPKTLVVGEQEHRADLIFINAGCYPAIPPVPGIDTVPYLTSKTILDIPVIPAHLVVLGGGYIALEMGQLFKRLGSEVTLIERGKALLSREDEDIQQAMQQFLEEEGIRVYLDTQVRKVSSWHRDAPATDALMLDLDPGSGSLSASHLLVATGRAPRTAELHLERTGVEMDAHGFIKVDDQLQTNVPGIYALGDIKGGPAFTHISYNDYIIISRNLLDKANMSIKDRQVPYTVFTDPQLGRIGLTEKEALAQGLPIRTAILPMTHVARAIETGHTKGLMKAIVHTDTRQILGAAILGEEGGEVMTVLQMAMAGGITYDTIRDMVFAHPLYAESLNNLFLTLER
ncbi:mercuric reductase [Dinghuibacter silviterrae]|uniref:Pyruvate/2-oxoglutarate dehydrogenase complex dihydrolipoamide dehydrogenase (E3) component n=1 Tax=Dinghuibacter silviterrae TaxID=1539049 RepID=A0A4R8DVC2_9BACT|nr:mercuric reductase [Dinghuibacter silviterrae]TDX02372.1 pyruvate/2-oxoglutarate dehydrogenase complex dihydrolipoamide dehydrogenase (E3) component [Dinghuibacter silviterrae]